MDKIDWTAILVSFFTNLAGIIGATTVLLMVIKNGFKSISDKVDGHFSKLIDLAGNAKELGGKVDALLTTTQQAPTKPVPIEDGYVHKRRTDNHNHEAP